MVGYRWTARGKRFNACYSPEKGTFWLSKRIAKETVARPYCQYGMLRRPCIRPMKAGYNPYAGDARLSERTGLPVQYEPPVSGQCKPFVLIIDEINRGNVADLWRADSD